METIIINIDPNNIDLGAIDLAASMIREGRIVAFPTETVYGLGANALDAMAVSRIFKAKGRPQDNPLIVHISDLEMLKPLIKTVPPKAKILMQHFWPGPLTIIMSKSDLIPYEVTAGLDTVGIRMPNNKVALSLIERSGLPIAAPSANISGRPSPTKPEHVIHDMYGRVDAIIAAGPCDVGLESTVLDVTKDRPKLFRPGAITLEMLQQIVGPVDIAKGVLAPVDIHQSVPSPGMKYTHYSPEARVIVVDGPIDMVVKRICAEAKVYEENGYKVGIMATEQTKDMYDGYLVLVVGDRLNPKTIAFNLFNILRRFDELGVDIIIAEAVNTEEMGLAIMNRLDRAAGFDIIRV